MRKVYWLTAKAERISLDTAQRFWKELIRAGRWVNTAAGFALEVDLPRLELWKQNFDAMQEAGIRVPVPWGHSYDPRDNAGFVESLEIRGDALWGLLDIPNAEDAEKIGNTVLDVSVSINTNFVDGSGREWGEVIEHVALTNYPVVTDQNEFVEEETGGEPASEDEALTLELAQPAKRNGMMLELNQRIYRLERERAAWQVNEALRQGKFTRPAADALHRLLEAGICAKYAMDAGARSAADIDIAALARTVIEATPAGAVIDMTERTRVRPMSNAPAGQMDEARAAQMARENRRLAGL